MDWIITIIDQWKRVPRINAFASSLGYNVDEALKPDLGGEICNV